MTDPRVAKLANILVNYSIKVQKGEWILVNGSTIAMPLIVEVQRAILEAGGHPTIFLQDDVLTEGFMRHADEEQLKWSSPMDAVIAENIAATIGIRATANTRFMSNIPPQKQQTRQLSRLGMMEIIQKREMAGDFRWVGTQYPCQALAQEADMSLSEFEDFVYQATFADQDDPVAAWQKVHDEQAKLIDWLKGKKLVTVKGPNVDLSLSIEGRSFINADGTANMPSGEVFTSPVEDSANGWIRFSYPAINQGREVEGVELTFKDGRVVKASATKNEAFLISMLDTDEGARVMGEFAVGTNYGIDRFTKSILYDEKIGGTIHVAVGRGFHEAGGNNMSMLHWDMICDMRQDSEIRVDGELFYKDGQFQI
ncbi:MAG TPA: aminopeptidase [Anaerolineae bacterium]|nr:aminopeptidase [Anaerolineae bacterium]